MFSGKNVCYMNMTSRNGPVLARAPLPSPTHRHNHTLAHSITSLTFMAYKSKFVKNRRFKCCVCDLCDGYTVYNTKG